MEAQVAELSSQAAEAEGLRQQLAAAHSAQVGGCLRDLWLFPLRMDLSQLLQGFPALITVWTGGFRVRVFLP